MRARVRAFRGASRAFGSLFARCSQERQTRSSECYWRPASTLFALKNWFGTRYSRASLLTPHSLSQERVRGLLGPGLAREVVLGHVQAGAVAGVSQR